MNCRKATRSLGPFLDGELSAALGEELERHLTSCPSCALRHRRMQAMLGELSSFPSISPTPREREELLRRVRRELSEPATAPAFHRRAQLAAAAISMLAVAVIAGVAFTLWRGEQAPVSEEAVSTPQESRDYLSEEGNPAGRASAEEADALQGTVIASLSPTPSLAVAGREYDEEELKGYREDLGARLEFYSAYWYPATMGALSEADLRSAQRELTHELAASAASHGGNPESLEAAIETALAQAGGDTLLPCHAELAKVNGRECWLVSLSGPEDYLLFPDPQRPPAMALASLGGEESLKVSESLLRELAAGLAPYQGASPPKPPATQPDTAGKNVRESEGGGLAPGEQATEAPEGDKTAAAESRADFQSFLRQLAARYNSLDMLGKLESLNYEQVIMLLHGNWESLAAQGVNLGDFLRPPRRLWAVYCEGGEIIPTTTFFWKSIR